MNLPSTNRLWSETSGITSVFCRGYLMTDSNGVNKASLGLSVNLNSDKIFIKLVLLCNQRLDPVDIDVLPGNTKVYSLLRDL